MSNKPAKHLTQLDFRTLETLETSRPLDSSPRTDAQPTPVKNIDGHISKSRRARRKRSFKKLIDTKTSYSPFSSSPKDTFQGRGHLNIQDESLWMYYEKDYNLELGGPVTVAARKLHPNIPVMVRKVIGVDAESKIEILRRLQQAWFVSCLEIYRIKEGFNIVTEYMDISLVEIVAVPKPLSERQVGAIAVQLTKGLEFLESQQLVHGSINTSNVLVNSRGEVKITNQECCRGRSTTKLSPSRDIQDLGDIITQLVTKRSLWKNSLQEADTAGYSPAILNFISATFTSSARDLARHAFLKGGWEPDNLLSLVTFAQKTSEMFYDLNLGEEPSQTGS